MIVIEQVMKRQKAELKLHAFAFIWVDDKTADFTWEVYDDRETLVEDFLEKKEDVLQQEKDAAVWCFVKMPLGEDVYGIDVYEYIEQHLAEEGYEYYMCTYPYEEGKRPDKEMPYYIEQVHIEYQWVEECLYRATLPKREAVICDGYLYFLACEDITEENKYVVADQIIRFREQFDSIHYGRAYGMNADNMYWLEHMQRESRLENPNRIFTEERASTFNTYWNGEREWTDYFGMMTDAEYRIELSPDMPKLLIRFRYAKEAEEGCYEFCLEEGKRNTDLYRMEVRTAEDDRLLQEETIQLSVWKTDMISFEDLDGDGYLDMKVIYPEYGGRDTDLTVCDEAYWLWDRETEKFQSVQKTELSASQEESDIPSTKEETEPEQQEISPTLSFVVKEGDSLWKLAEKYYGDGQYWGEIYENNRITIGEDPSMILPGMEFEIGQ